MGEPEISGTDKESMDGEIRRRAGELSSSGPFDGVHLGLTLELLAKNDSDFIDSLLSQFPVPAGVTIVTGSGGETRIAPDVPANPPGAGESREFLLNSLRTGRVDRLTLLEWAFAGALPNGTAGGIFGVNASRWEAGEATGSVAMFATKDFSVSRLSGGDVESFIKEAYLRILGRDVDGSGLEQYTRSLRSGEMDRSDLLFELSRSDEALRRKTETEAMGGGVGGYTERTGLRGHEILREIPLPPRWRRMPVLGSLLLLFHLPLILKKINRLERRLEERLTELETERVADLERTNRKISLLASGSARMYGRGRGRDS